MASAVEIVAAPVTSKTCMIVSSIPLWRLRDGKNSVRVALAGRQSRLRRQREVVDITIVHARGRAIDHPVPLDRAQLQELRVQEVAALLPRNRRSVDAIEHRHYRVPDDFDVLEVHAGADALTNRSIELGGFCIILHVHGAVDGVLRIEAIRIEEEFADQDVVRSQAAVPSAVAPRDFHLLRQVACRAVEMPVIDVFCHQV